MKHAWVVAWVGLIAATGVAGADIINGSFDWASNPLNQWTVIPSFIGTASATAVDSYGGQSGVMRLSAETPYVAAPGAWVNQLGFGFYPFVTAMQEVAVSDGRYAPAGTTALEFKVAMTFGDQAYLEPPFNDDETPTMELSVLYSSSQGEESVFDYILDNRGTWLSRQIELPDLDVTQPISIVLRAFADREPEVSGNVGDTATMNLNVYVDEFHFVPEPMSLLLLTAGTGLLLRRRK